jgi:hypothetical protein
MTNLVASVLLCRAVVLNLCSWRPTEQSSTLFGDPFSTILLLKDRVWRPKLSAHNPSVEKQRSRALFVACFILIENQICMDIE